MCVLSIKKATATDCAFGICALGLLKFERIDDLNPLILVFRCTIAPTMESGPKAIGLMKFNKKRDPEHDKLKALYISVYSRAVEEGLTDFEKIQRSGISAYMGTASCNQVANGLYLRLNGQIQMCPGASNERAVFGNVHENSIANIWQESSNYKLGALENNWCAAKANGMPKWLQDEILATLTEKYSTATPHPRPAPARRRMLSAPAPPA